jgi:hypothetical protein
MQSFLDLVLRSFFDLLVIAKLRGKSYLTSYKKFSETGLTAQLRRCPTWKQGHLLLGENSLSSYNLPLAHGCCEALRKLEGESFCQQLLYGRLCVRTHKFQQAVKILGHLFHQPNAVGRSKTLIAEELLAGLLATDDYKEAEKVLASFSFSDRTAQMNLVAQVLGNK